MMALFHIYQWQLGWVDEIDKQSYVHVVRHHNAIFARTQESFVRQGQEWELYPKITAYDQPGLTSRQIKRMDYYLLRCCVRLSNNDVDFNTIVETPPHSCIILEGELVTILA